MEPENQEVRIGDQTCSADELQLEKDGMDHVETRDGFC